jgi:hypothetical protein
MTPTPTLQIQRRSMTAPRDEWVSLRPASVAEVRAAGRTEHGQFWLDVSDQPYHAPFARRPSDRVARIVAACDLCGADVVNPDPARLPAECARCSDSLGV